MLNIKELRKQFDEILNSLTEQDLLKWLEFAEQRENFQKLSKGEIVKLQVLAEEQKNK